MEVNKDHALLAYADDIILIEGYRILQTICMTKWNEQAYGVVGKPGED